MEITEKIFVTALTHNSVSILRQQFVDVDGETLKVGSDWRCAYMNSPLDRERLQSEVPDPYYSSILAVWGDQPTVEDPVTPVLEDVLDDSSEQA